MRTRRSAVTAALLAVALLVITACSGKSVEPRRTLDTTAAPGMVVVSDNAAGFAVSIPSSWMQMPRDVGGFDTAADALRSSSPSPAKLATGLTQLKSVVRNGASMVAIDPATGATANLIVLDAGGQSPSEIAAGSANQLRQNGATNVTHESLTVDGVKAVRQRFHTPFPGDTGPVDLAESQLYAVRRGQAYILTLAGDSPALDTIASSLKLA